MRHLPPLSTALPRLPRPGTPSLTTRLGLSFGATMAVVLVGVSAAMYGELTQQLQGKEDAELRADLQRQMQVLEAIAQRRTPGSWQREWQQFRNADERFAWQLIGAEGQVRAASANAAAFDRALAHAGLPPHRVLLVDTMRADRIAGRGSVLRGILDVSRDRHLVDAYRTSLVGAVLLAVALSTGLCWHLARRALAPLHAIGAKVAGIGTGQLHVRVADAGWPGELHALAAAFDGVLARIEQSYAQLTRFSADLAHEFRSPVNQLVAAAGVTLARPRDVAAYQHALEIVVDEGERLARMISSLLFLASIDNGRHVLQRERVLLADEFRKLIAFFDIAAEEKGVRLEAAGSETLDADPALLRRALSKLLTNALQHTAKGGLVRLQARRVAGAIAISVLDDGAGIAPAHLPFVFDRFYRADPARSASDSNGLGLAVVLAIARLHGGSADATSVPGQGSCFTLRFPSGPDSGPSHQTPHEDHLA